MPYLILISTWTLQSEFVISDSLCTQYYIRSRTLFHIRETMMNRKIIITVGALDVCLFACVMVGNLIFNDHEEYSLDYGYVYEGFYLDISDEDYMLTHYSKNDGTSGLLSFTNTGGTRSVKMYEDKEHTREVINKLPVKGIVRSENYSLITFLGEGGGNVSDIENFAKAYSKLHPELTGIHPIPTFWGWTQCYLLDNDTGQLHYLPVCSATYDFDNKKIADVYGIGGHIIGFSDKYCYYLGISDLKDNLGAYRLRVIDGVVENEKLFDTAFSSIKVTKNDILVISDTLLLPDGTKIVAPQDYEILNGMLCTNVE